MDLRKVCFFLQHRMRGDAPSAVGIVVVADDLGVNEARTAGILSAAEVVGAASLLVNGEAATYAATMATEHHIPLRLHFNLTEGFPLGEHSYRSDNVLLSQGRFLGKAGLLMRLSHVFREGNQMMLDDLRHAITIELHAQVKAFCRLTGHGNVFLDGHHHIHVVPVVFDCILAGFEQLEQSGYRLRGIRIPFDPALQMVDDTPPTFDAPEECFGVTFWRKISSMALLAANRLPSNVTRPHAFVGFDLMGPDCDIDALRAKLLAVIPAARADAADWNESPIIEIMTHMGFPYDGDGQDPFFHNDFSRSEWRRKELELYTSPQFKVVCEELGAVVRRLF